MTRSRGFEVVSRYQDSNIQLPQRSTKNSAGYDFYAPEDIIVPKTLFKFYEHKPTCIKTGIKAFMQDDELLQLYLRSSSPSKLGIVMANSVGIIDSDYYNNADNEGEIGFLVYNLSDSDIKISKGEKIGQGVFTKFLKTWDDNQNELNERVGGFGSTGK